MFRKVRLLINTVKYLKWTQLFGRLIYHLPRFIKEDSNLPNIINYNDLDFINKVKITSDFNEFVFLNKKNNLTNIGWNNNVIPKLWNYNLHYFDYLNTIEYDIDDTRLKLSVIEKWIMENPFGFGIGWEPYPTSLRIVNWVKWHLKTRKLNKLALLNLWNQTRWLSDRPENHLLGNHLFANAKAMIFSSIIFDCAESRKIQKKGIEILSNQIDEQYLKDGAHFELSPMYHSIAIEDLLDLLNIEQMISNKLPTDELRFKIFKGIFWLNKMSYPNSDLANFNDTSNKIAPTFEKIFEYANRLNIIPVFNNINETLVHFKESGFFIIEDSKIKLIGDIGNIGPDYIPGHAHADTLSFELAISGIRVFVNSGTSTYSISKEREFQRSTKAHNTIEVDNINSSEVWSSFRVAKRAYTLNPEITINDNSMFMVSSEHDGYKRINNGPLHKRTWVYNTKDITIIDNLFGEYNYAVSRYYIHPELRVEKYDNQITISSQNKKLCLISCCLENDNISLNIRDSFYYPEFGISIPNKCIEISSENINNLVFKIELI